MIYYVNERQMKTIDQYSIQITGIPSLILMEQAATLVARTVKEAFPLKNLVAGQTPQRITIVAGVGNNGADGLAAARILYSQGYETEVYWIGNPEKATEEWNIQKHVIDQLGIPAYQLMESDLTKEKLSLMFAQSAVLIDGIFGIGLGRDISGKYKILIEGINALHKKVFAIDIPSGIYAATGQVAGAALRCQCTVTFGREKLGQHLYPGKNYCGKVISEALGFSPQAYEQAGASVCQLTMEDLKLLLPVRPPEGHKGTFGRVLVIAGCDNMAGAALFAAGAAYRTGAGLCKIVTVKENRDVILSSVPEAILSLYDPEAIEEQALRADIEWADAIVFGPGMGQSDYVTRMLETVLKFSKVPLIIDADGIRVLAKSEKLQSMLHDQVILTPHIGEMSALTGYSGSALLSDPVTYAVSTAKKLGTVLVMKSASTVIAFPEEMPALEDRGTNALGTAGSGDVLTGIIAALSAGGCDVKEAAMAGVFIHALAGKAAEAGCGARSSMATDILEGISAVLQIVDKQILDEKTDLQL